MTNAEDKKYIALSNKAERLHKKWRCVRDDTWGDLSQTAARREDSAYTAAKDAAFALECFEIQMKYKYAVAA